MKHFYSKESASVLAEVREELIKGNSVEWSNAYDTFYGASWYGWVQKNLADIKCTYKVTSWNKWYDGIPWCIVITPEK